MLLPDHHGTASCLRSEERDIHVSVNVKIPLIPLALALSAVPQIPAPGSELEKPMFASSERKLSVTDRCLVGTGEVVQVSAYKLMSSRELSLGM